MTSLTYGRSLQKCGIAQPPPIGGLIAENHPGYGPETMFRRSETRQQHGDERDEGMLLRVYQQGYNARLEGLPRTPPAGYEGLVGLDLTGTWAEGWDGAGASNPL